MKKAAIILLILLVIYSLVGCAPEQKNTQIIATTLPVYEFTSRLCDGTGLQVSQLVSENVSCLHDYTLQVDQMRMLEGAEVVVINGGGLEAFMSDILTVKHSVIDSSKGVTLCSGGEHHHDHSDHHHDADPHIWLSPAHAKTMVRNICSGLTAVYPQYSDTFTINADALLADLDALLDYGNTQLNALQCRSMITFHDGFSYFAEAYDLTILRSVEEESGSEASSLELIELIEMIREHQIPSIFTEVHGSASSANIISAETGVGIFTLDMAMSGNGYFEAMYHNIDTVKEALG